MGAGVERKRNKRVEQDKQVKGTRERERRMRNRRKNGCKGEQGRVKGGEEGKGEKAGVRRGRD